MISEQGVSPQECIVYFVCTSSSASRSTRSCFCLPPFYHQLKEPRDSAKYVPNLCARQVNATSMELLDELFYCNRVTHSIYPSPATPFLCKICHWYHPRAPERVDTWTISKRGEERGRVSRDCSVF